MKNILLLTKAQFIEIFNFNSNNKKSKTQLKFLTLFILVSLFGLFISFFYNFSFYMNFKTVGNQNYYFPYVYILVTLLILLTTTVKSKASLFNTKDFEFLNSLPIKSTEIVASKILVLYLYELYFTSLFILPSLVFIFTYAGITGSIIGFLLIFLIPIIPLLLSSIFGFIIAYFIDRFKFSSLIISIIFSISILVLLGYFYYTSVINTDNSSTQLVSFVDNIDKYIPIPSLLIKVISGDIRSILIILSINIIIFTIFIFLFGKAYVKTNKMLLQSNKKTKYVSKQLKSSKKIISLIKKDFSRMMSNSTYFMNVAISGIMSIFMIFLVYYIFKTTSQVENVPSGLLDMISKYIVLVIIFSIGMAPSSASSISVEGKYFWILKSSPISVSELIKSKVYFSVLILAIPGVISGVIAGILFKASVINFISLIFTPIIYSFLISIIGILVNLKFPKMEWKSEVVAIKNSASVIITLLLSYLLDIVIIVPYIFISLVSINFALLFLNGIILILLITFYYILKNNATKLIASI